MKFLDFVFTKYEIEDKELVKRYNKLMKVTKRNRLKGTENPWGEGRREGQVGRLEDTSYCV